MNGLRFNEIRQQLVLYEQLQPSVIIVTPIIDGVSREDCAFQQIAGVDMLPFVGAFEDCRKLLRELVDAAKADNGDASPDTEAPVGAPPAGFDPRREPVEAGEGASAGEFSSPSYHAPAPGAAAIPLETEQGQLHRFSSPRMFSTSDQASVIETLAEAVAELAQTTRELGSQVAELSRK